MRISEIIACLILVSFTSMFPFKIDRVILAADANPFYLDFWPYAARAWKQLIGVTPTLALVADESVQVDESLGEVIRFRPIKGMPAGLQAQVIRLLLPVLFPHDICILSDIDQLPLKKSYFHEPIASIPPDKFVIYNDDAYRGAEQRFPICYCVAKGTTFRDLFHVSTIQGIRRLMGEWYRFGWGFHTDELVLYRSLMDWKEAASRLVKLGDGLGPSDKRRINRAFWHYDPALLKKGYYVDAHLLRPYKRYKKELDALAQLAGVRS